MLWVVVVVKGGLSEESENPFPLKKNTTPQTASSSGTRAGLFRTPISGGVQSATSAHGLPRPALAVRNLMEQVLILIYLTHCSHFLVL